MRSRNSGEDAEDEGFPVEESAASMFDYPLGLLTSITMTTVEGTTGTSEMEQSASASVHKVKVVAPCNTGSGALSSKLSGGTAGLSELCRWKAAMTTGHRPEDKPTPIIWFTVFVVGLFLNVFSISVSALILNFAFQQLV